MRILFFITKEMKEKLWLESGRVENQRQEIELEPSLLSPEVRKALGVMTEYQIPLEDAFSVDPEHKEILTEKILKYLCGAPVRKEKLNLKYRLEDLEKKKANIEISIRLTERVASDLAVKIENDFKAYADEASRLREEANRTLDEAEKNKERSTINLKTTQAKIEERKTALAETLSLMDTLRARYDELK